MFQVVPHIFIVRNNILMKKIILIGGGGHCKSVIDVIEQEAQFKIAGIVDKSELLGSKILGYQVIGNDFDLENLATSNQNLLNQAKKWAVTLEPKIFQEYNITLANELDIVVDDMLEVWFADTKKQVVSYE